jgi:ribonuclease P protein component
MTPPMAPQAGNVAPDRGATAVLSCPMVLNKRADFVRASAGLRQGTVGFHLQARARGDGDGMRIGYTCSKKVGNAVARNRAKRRLREVARLVLPAHGRPGWDYVLVGRAAVTASHDFKAMQVDLVQALARIHSL